MRDYISTHTVRARKVKPGERIVTWDGIVTPNEGDWVVQTGTEILVVNSKRFDTEYSLANPRITAIVKTAKGYTVRTEDGKHEWYSDEQFVQLLDGWSVPRKEEPATDSAPDVLPSVKGLTL